MKLRQSLIWLLSALLLTCFSTVMAGRLSIGYTPGNTAENRAIEKTLKTGGVFKRAIKELNQIYRFPNNLTITFINKYEAHFSPKKNSIIMGYPYLNAIAQKFLKNRPSSSEELKNYYMQNVGVWIFMHELCHSLILLYHLPTVGNQEIAADSFATVITLQHLSNGDYIALMAAARKRYAAKKLNQITKFDLTDLHTLARQRQYFILCMVYGYNPKAAKKRFDRWNRPTLNKFIKVDGKICIEDYTQQKYAWATLMRKYRR